MIPTRYASNGTITDTVFDSMGRIASTWVGTNDAVSNAAGTPAYFDGTNAGSGNNMTETASYVYDNPSFTGTTSGVGDSNLSEIIAYPDGNTVGTQRVTLMSEGIARPIGSTCWPPQSR